MKIGARTTALAVATLLLVIGAASYVTYLVIQAERLHIFETVCNHNNVDKADDIWRVQSAKTAFGSKRAWRQAVKRQKQLKIVLDCKATFDNDGSPVPLTPPQADAFVKVVGRGRIPVVEDGKVTGSYIAETREKANF